MIILIKKVATTYFCQCDSCQKHFKLSAWGWKHHTKVCPYCEVTPKVEEVDISETSFVPVTEIVIEEEHNEERKIETEKIVNKKSKKNHK